MNQLVKHNDQKQKQEFDYFRSLASVAAKGGTNTMSVETLMNIMLTAKDLGISPMKAINGGFYVVNGKISMSTALMADRIRKEGHSIKIPEWTSEKCVVIGVRKDNGDSIKFEYTMQDAQVAGLSHSATWKKFPKQMLYNRAMSTLARTLFSDVVGNAYSEDEKWDIMNVPPEKRPVEDPDRDIEVSPSLQSVEQQQEENQEDAIAKIEEEEIASLTALAQKLDDETQKSFLDWIGRNFNAKTIQDIPKICFEKCMISLNAKIKYINDKNKENVAVAV
jgi:hypothetical protein